MVLHTYIALVLEVGACPMGHPYTPCWKGIVSSICRPSRTKSWLNSSL